MITDLFSKRQKRSRGEVPDVYQYETIPHECGSPSAARDGFNCMTVWCVTCIRWRSNLMRNSYVAKKQRHLTDRSGQMPLEIPARGVLSVHTGISTKCYVASMACLHLLKSQYSSSYFESVSKFFLHIEDTEKIIDIIELSFQYIDTYLHGISTKCSRVLS